MSKWTAERLRAFEQRIQEAIEAGSVKGPCHLSGGNEDELIRIFDGVQYGDWCFATYRSHYHALLHGVPEQYVLKEILAGRSMSLHSPLHRFYTPAIVGGCLPISVGVAAALKRYGKTERVWCFVGDMAASAGTFHDCEKYVVRNDLPINFVVEDNGMSTYTPTREAWGYGGSEGKYPTICYSYAQTVPHIGSTKAALL